MKFWLERVAASSEERRSFGLSLIPMRNSSQRRWGVTVSTSGDFPNNQHCFVSVFLDLPKTGGDCSKRSASVQRALSKSHATMAIHANAVAATIRNKRAVSIISMLAPRQSPVNPPSRYFQ